MIFSFNGQIFFILSRRDRAMNYRILLRQEPEGGFTVTVPSLPGCVTFGETLDEAIGMAKEAIGLYIESLKDHGEIVPTLEH